MERVCENKISIEEGNLAVCRKIKYKKGKIEKDILLFIVNPDAVLSVNNALVFIAMKDKKGIYCI